MHLIVGRIGRAHGVGGDVTVEIRTDEPERRFMPGAVLLTDPPSAGPLTIENSRMNNATLLLRFQGVQNRDAAQALRDTLLLVEVDIDELSEDPDEFYDHQLVGLKVVTEDGIEVGRITGIGHAPLQDLVIIERANGNEVLVPFVQQIITEIDLAEQCAVLNPPPGLIDDRTEAASPPGSTSTSNREDDVTL
ncbi:ribosome maturation factor RimM [Streptomyces sp. ME02-6987-2C]|uniref:ribosome maturation factor RimM n=1 Tax=unclassified Streptomyces TaxID=2593676 RepID=UPI0029BD1EA8|nr:MULTISPECIES: ribosome maturation factor RimM [unclassified Streptomyces]MDX3370182.1 ribosome maturation factor RimM [Streptomyces sp. ME02-6987-2C]MDX3427072.1 ribosome maturation factor RimM [Streptomyces sp. ME02-6985-2c]